MQALPGEDLLTPMKQLQTILNKAKRSNFLPSNFSALEELFDSADSALFRAVLTILFSSMSCTHSSLLARIQATIYVNVAMA